MGFNICSIQEKRLVDRLSALKVIGEVIEKKTVESSGDQPERKVVVVRFKIGCQSLNCELMLDN